jgi:hypothetical protein
VTSTLKYKLDIDYDTTEAAILSCMKIDTNNYKCYDFMIESMNTIESDE